MTTKQIDYCIELARTESFSRGAENMFVSQPTFSYQIKLLEEEVGFEIFVRNGKGATLTPAGQQFVTYLSNMRKELKRAIEQAQNFSSKYQDNITISLMVRQALYFLPEAIKDFEKNEPGVQITPLFQYENGMDSFLKNESDVVFALEEQTKQLAGTTVHQLFKSHIYLVCDKNDPLASKNLITDEDIYGRTLMVGGGSPALLRSIQQKLISSGKIEYFNSPDHDTTHINIAADKGICLSPGFLNDHSGQFAWIPYDCDDTFSCVLCTHKADQRQSLDTFIKVLQKLYNEAVAFPL
ncbi:LysR family transcriptional regulator [Pseudobutyrivibrio xylanivorans]|uniref:DNA-binding transcriptional regulator, LysR family n=1 Tax=Pseudobutyrivibrio xylanivorans TaxID=185007 RepID=A0A1G5RXC5_PSEXY|nr:LysR family transcriptional regulator [Pseudobutyrivibrio xylanivorans]SCZ77979.1 DNA-binding transcriptional regulator, LysR family [Pseudobutyrivibrio xylanivorans]